MRVTKMLRCRMIRNVRLFYKRTWYRQSYITARIEKGTIANFNTRIIEVFAKITKKTLKFKICGVLLSRSRTGLLIDRSLCVRHTILINPRIMERFDCQASTLGLLRCKWIVINRRVLWSGLNECIVIAQFTILPEWVNCVWLMTFTVIYHELLVNISVKLFY